MKLQMSIRDVPVKLPIAPFMSAWFDRNREWLLNAKKEDDSLTWIRALRPENSA